MQDKLVSIIIPTYNRADLIGETIQSVIDQSYKNWELIIVDDGSDDQTEEVIKKFNNPSIYYFKIEHSGNLGKVRNTGIKVAKGEYIAFLDSDDLWEKNKLATQLSLLDRYPESRFCLTDGIQFGEGAVDTPNYQELFIGNIFYEALVHHKFSARMTSLVFHRVILDKVGYLNERWTEGGDVDFFYRLAYHYICIFCNERLVKVRRHKESTSQLLGDITYTEFIEMLNVFHNDKWLTKSEWNQLVSEIQYRMALDKVERNQPINALTNFMHYVKLRPFHWRRWARASKSLGGLLFVSIFPSSKK
jgi:glycosyltransferase involved in cell wall biosynthesis